MDGSVNSSYLHHSYGWAVLLDRRMGFWHLSLFSIHNVSYHWVWRRRTTERAGILRFLAYIYLYHAIKHAAILSRVISVG